MAKKKSKVAKSVVSEVAKGQLRKALIKRVVKALALRVPLLGAFPFNFLASYFVGKILSVLSKNAKLAYDVFKSNRVIEKQLKKLEEVLNDEELSEEDKKKAYSSAASDFLRY